MVPANTTAQKLKTPLKARAPEKGITTSLGNGMQADSKAMVMMIPQYPVASKIPREKLPRAVMICSNICSDICPHTT